MAAALALHAIAVHSIGHAGMMIPETRNAVDREARSLGHLAMFGRNLTGFSYRGHGQAALWWSQGCSIGCDYCLTDPKHPDNNGSIPNGPIRGNNPHSDKAGFRKSYCASPKTKAVLPKEYWTMNIHAVDGAVNDSYRFNPWRAPGSAPVVDPCGQAGGKFQQTRMGGDSTFSKVDVDGKIYQMGDLGSKVLPATDLTTWKVGSTPRVAWGMRFNHGGGYQYRLCPLEKWPCTEQDFQQMPLDFVRGSQAMMWNNGTLYPIPHAAKYVDDSVCPVVPKGSTWARSPVPRIHTDTVGMAFVGKCVPPQNPGGTFKEDCQMFPTPCPELEHATPANKMMGEWYGGSNGLSPSQGGPKNQTAFDGNSHEGWCSGDWTLGMISDEVVIPKDIKPGKYVMSWRWDCEETVRGITMVTTHSPCVLRLAPCWLLPSVV